MSYPTVGMTGVVAGDKWDAAAVEGLLRGGIRIYEDDDTGASYFDKEKGKFVFDVLVRSSEGVLAVAVDKSKEFENYAELTTWIAFWGKNFL